MSHPNTEKRKIWDLFIRLFHWSLVIAVVSGWLLGRFGPSVMTLHYYAGYAVGGLLVLRVIWGFVGSKPARFGAFLYGPRAVLAYVRTMFRRAPSYWPGHNPVGALSVFALLGVLAAQVATGLIADPDDFVNVGPLAGWVEFDTARWAARTHRMMSNLLLALIGLHVGALLFYRLWKREDLLRPMITGWKEIRKDHPDA